MKPASVERDAATWQCDAWISRFPVVVENRNRGAGWITENRVRRITQDDGEGFVRFPYAVVRYEYAESLRLFTRRERD